MTARYADRDEVFEAGDAFYTPPGHVPVAERAGHRVRVVQAPDERNVRFALDPDREGLASCCALAHRRDRDIVGPVEPPVLHRFSPLTGGRTHA